MESYWERKLNRRISRRRAVAGGVVMAGGVAALSVMGCGGSDDGESAELTVVATTTQTADLLRNVAAERVEAHQILGAIGRIGRHYWARILKNAFRRGGTPERP